MQKGRQLSSSRLPLAVFTLVQQRWRLEPLEIAGRPVAGIDDGRLDIFLGYRGDESRFGGNIDLAVVVGRGLRRHAALEIGDGGGDGILDENTYVLEDRHGLLAIDDVLDGRDFGILSGDVVLLDGFVGGEGVGDGSGGAVIGGGDIDGAFLGSFGDREVGFGFGLGVGEVPVRGYLADDAGLLIPGENGFLGEGGGLAGIADDEGSVGDLGLEHFPGAFEEEEGVVVGSGARIEVEVVAFAFGVLHEVIAPGHADLDGVERDIIVHGSRVADEAVIGDDFHARFVGFVRRGGRGRPVLRADDEDFYSLGDQGFYVGFFLCRIALAEEDFGADAGSLERVHEPCLVLDPAGFILRGQDDADLDLGKG